MIREKRPKSGQMPVEHLSRFCGRRNYDRVNSGRLEVRPHSYPSDGWIAKAGFRKVPFGARPDWHACGQLRIQGTENRFRYFAEGVRAGIHFLPR